MLSKILKKRLNECNITLEEILKRIPFIEEMNVSVFIYSSHMDGLGNSKSDLDIYILVNEMPVDEKKLSEYYDCKSRMEKIDELMVDLEYWEYNQLYKIIESRLYIRDIAKMKLLCRLLKGDVILGEDKGNQIKQAIEKIDIRTIVAEFFQNSTTQEFDDATKMLKSGNGYCTLSCARRALDYVMAAYNAKKGVAVLNIKWVPQIIINSKGFGNEYLLRRYLQLQFYNKITDENVNDLAEDMLTFISEMMFDICCT